MPIFIAATAVDALDLDLALRAMGSFTRVVAGEVGEHGYRAVLATEFSQDAGTNARFAQGQVDVLNARLIPATMQPSEEQARVVLRMGSPVLSAA